MRSFLSLALLCSLVTANPVVKQNAAIKARTDQSKPPAGAIVVDATGAVPGSFKTVQAGANALTNHTTATQTLFIMAGTYNEQVYLRPLKSALVVQGQTAHPESYESNTVTIIMNLNRNTRATNDETATVRNWVANSKFYNINMENNAGHPATLSQNIVISAQAPNQGYYGCQFIGYQDNILAQNGTQLYAKSKIVGVVDFIFGTGGKVWFEQVDIRTFAIKGYITASGRLSADSDAWFVINNSTIAARDNDVNPGSTYLGRPWKEYSRTVFQKTEMSNVVNPAGWSQWNATLPNTAHSYLAEYGNTGPGAARTGRAAFAKQLSAPITIEAVLGPKWKTASYVDTTYM
ncbi:hypothetical protein WAI453_008462 [Rhynchosporium graminicola]